MCVFQENFYNMLNLHYTGTSRCMPSCFVWKYTNLHAATLAPAFLQPHLTNCAAVSWVNGWVVVTGIYLWKSNYRLYPEGDVHGGCGAIALWRSTAWYLGLSFTWQSAGLVGDIIWLSYWFFVESSHLIKLSSQCFMLESCTKHVSQFHFLWATLELLSHAAARMLLKYHYLLSWTPSTKCVHPLPLNWAVRSAPE